MSAYACLYCEGAFATEADWRASGHGFGQPCPKRPVVGVDASGNRDPLSIPCPLCGAERRQRCMTLYPPARKSTAFHAARLHDTAKGRLVTELGPNVVDLAAARRRRHAS